jgi:hypothetical protein
MNRFTHTAASIETLLSTLTVNQVEELADMDRKFIVALLAIAALFSLPFAIAAQDAAPELVPVTVGDLVRDPGLYVGQTVIIEDTISEYINPQSFLLGEDAAIGEARVLVVNTSGHPLPFTMFAGDRVVVTGVVHPSLQMRLDNGEVTLPEDRLAFRQTYTLPDFNDLGDTTDDILPTVDPAATTDPAATLDPAATVEGSMDMTATPEGSTDMDTTTDMDMTGDMVSGSMEAIDFYYGGGFPERLDGYLIIEVSSLDDLSHLLAEE